MCCIQYMHGMYCTMTNNGASAPCLTFFVLSCVYLNGAGIRRGTKKDRNKKGRHGIRGGLLLYTQAESGGKIRRAERELWVGGGCMWHCVTSHSFGPLHAWQVCLRTYGWMDEYRRLSRRRSSVSPSSDFVTAHGFFPPSTHMSLICLYTPHLTCLFSHFPSWVAQRAAPQSEYGFI